MNRYRTTGIILQDEEAMQAIELLHERGYSIQEIERGLHWVSREFQDAVEQSIEMLSEIAGKK